MVLNDISLEVNKNEVTVLVGPSGCGKTTLMRCIVGFETPESGEIFIDGQNVQSLKPKDRKIAMVFQYYSLYPNMNVRQNLSAGLENTTDLSREEIYKKIGEMAKLLNISKLLDRKPSQLSGGEAQRVAIGRALVRNPEIIFLDEPLSAVDTKLRRELRSEIRNILKEFEVTAIYVTHDQEEAMAIADNMVLMGNGKIYDVGSPEQMYREPKTKYAASLLGRPPMNFFRVSVQADAGEYHLANEELSFDVSENYFQRYLEKYKDKEVIVGIRPSDISLQGGMAHDTKFGGTVEDVENLGDEIYIYMSNQEQKYVVKVPETEHIEPGSQQYFKANEMSLHVFDADTEKSIIYQ
jgi:multiple sugar transport system ATP-binding protein